MPQADKLVASTWEKPISRPESIPASAGIVVIGGGIVGVSTAWFLARQGIDVVLCEKGHVAGEQSGRNWGWVRQQGRDTREMPMIVESLRIWRGLEQEIGESVGFNETGVLFSANTDKELDSLAGWLETAAEYDLDTRIIDGDEMARLVHGSTVRWRGALYTASDGRAEPHKAARPMRVVVAEDGCTWLCDADVDESRDLNQQGCWRCAEVPFTRND